MKDQPRREKVSRIDALKAVLVQASPPYLLVSAVGAASSPGWHEPALVPQKDQTEDGVLSLEFVATRPAAPQIAVLMPASAELVYEGDTSKIRAVKASSASNAIQVEVIHVAPAQVRIGLLPGGGGDGPSPFVTPLDMSLRPEGGGSGDGPSPFRR